MVDRVMMILCEECGVSAAPCSFSQVLDAIYMSGKVCIAGENDEVGGYISAKAAFICSLFKFPSPMRVSNPLWKESINVITVETITLLSGVDW